MTYIRAGRFYTLHLPAPFQHIIYGTLFGAMGANNS